MFLLTTLLLILIISSATITTLFIWPKVRLSWLNRLSYFLVLSLPFERLPSIDAGGFNIRLSQILVLTGFYFLIILILKKDQKLFNLKLKTLTWFILGFWVALIPSMFFAVNEIRQYQVMIATALVFGAAFLVAHFNQFFAKTIANLSFVLAGVSVFGIYQFLGDFIGLPTSLTFLRIQYTKQVFGFARVQATAIEPLYWGGMLLTPSIWLLLTLMSVKAHKMSLNRHLILIGALILVYLNLVLTLSRGAYLAYGVSVLVTVIAAFKIINWTRVFKIILPLVFLVVIPGFIYLANSQYYKLVDTALGHVSDVFTDEQASTVERLSYLNEAFRMLPENLVFGIGSGNYGPRLDAGTNSEGWLIVNNVYLEILLEQGITALLVFVSMFLYYVWKGFGAALDRFNAFEEFDLNNRIALISVLAALVGYLVQWLTFSPIFIMPIFILLGLLVSYFNADGAAIESSAEVTNSN